MIKITKLFIVLLFAGNTLLAQDKKKWDVSNPAGTYKDVSFTTSEGTWMNVDVSPDGKEIVFDLLGDIYAMPVSGWRSKSAAHRFSV